MDDKQATYEDEGTGEDVDMVNDAEVVVTEVSKDVNVGYDVKDIQKCRRDCKGRIVDKVASGK